MVKGLYTAYTGMINEQHRMDVLTNNLANANTNGYKKEGATSQSFNDQLALKIKDYTDAPFTARRLGVINPGVKIGEGYVDWTEGPMRETGNTFDLAIGGYGFFGIEYTNKAKNIEIATPNVTQIMYTRDGDFTLTSEGVLVTQDGDFVLDQDGQHIQLNPDLDTDINTRGELIQDGQVVATIGRFDFAKTTYPDGRFSYDTLEHYGENMYIATDQAEQIDATGQIYAGFLEQSNVSVVDEMVTMIAVQRNYDTNQRMITTVDETLEIAVNQLGKL